MPRGKFIITPPKRGRLGPHAGKRAFAKQMKAHPTAAEQALWERLQGNKLGFQIKRQKVMFGYIPDFISWKPKLCIEVDGSFHQLPEMQAYDAQRDAVFHKHGFVVLRYSNDRIFQDLENVLVEIQECANAILAISQH